MTTLPDPSRGPRALRPSVRALLGRLRAPGGIDRDAIDFQPDVAAIEEAPPPWGARATLYLALAVLGLAVLWSSLASLDRIVVAQGKLVTTRPTMVIQPLELGVIRSLDVSIGDAVRRGQVVATLDPTFAAADLAAQRDRLAALEAEARRLDAEAEGLTFVPRDGDAADAVQARVWADRQAVHAGKLALLGETIAKLDAGLATNRNAQAGLAERIAIYRRVEGMRNELLASNAGSKLQVMTAQASRLELEAALRKLEDEARELEHQRQAAEIERESFQRGWDLEISEKRLEVGRARDAMREEVAKAARRGSLVELRAPEDGVVLEVAERSVGSVAREAEPLVTIVPKGVPIEAEVAIPADDIASVRAGDPTRVKLDALPFQEHGTVDGTVRVIAENVAAAEARPDGTGGGAPTYRARVALGPVALRGVPADLRLVPGMTVHAEIKVGTRSVISYFLYPVLRVFDESLRDS